MARKQWLVFTGAVGVLIDSTVIAYYSTPLVGLIACFIGGLWVGFATAWLLGWIE